MVKEFTKLDIINEISKDLITKVEIKIAVTRTKMQDST